MLSRAVRRLPLSALRRGNAKRALGTSGKAVEGPYAVPQHKTYPDEAYFLGMGPDYKSQGFEWITIATYGICLSILVLGFSTRELESFKAWARAEAIAREQVKESGAEIEFGKYYNMPALPTSDEE